MSNARVRGRRHRRERRRLNTDPCTQPQQFKLLRHLVNTGGGRLHVDWTENAASLTVEERCAAVHQFLTGPGVDITDEIL